VPGRSPLFSRSLLFISALALAACAGSPRGEPGPSDADFATVTRVLQHPRCQNCHIAGSTPLQSDASVPHVQSVVRGPEGDGPRGLPCATCHGAANPPASYGKSAPPGAPNWRLPPPDQKMVFKDLSPAELCAGVKDPARNGGKNLAQLVEHVSHDPLVLWGWNPGHGRAPVPIPHAEFTAAFRRWVDAGARCPTSSS